MALDVFRQLTRHICTIRQLPSLELIYRIVSLKNNVLHGEFFTAFKNSTFRDRFGLDAILRVNNQIILFVARMLPSGEPIFIILSIFAFRPFERAGRDFGTRLLTF